MMNNINNPVTTEEEDLIATQTVDRAEDWCIDSNKLTQTPEANTEDVISSEELKDANKLVAELIASLMVMSAIEGSQTQKDDEADIAVKVIPFDNTQTEEYKIAA